MCEDMGEYPLQHPISTFQDNTMAICMNKVFIKQDFPPCLEQLSATVRIKQHQTCFWYARQATQNIFDTVGKLKWWLKSTPSWQASCKDLQKVGTLLGGMLLIEVMTKCTSSDCWNRGKVAKLSPFQSLPGEWHRNITLDPLQLVPRNFQAPLATSKDHPVPQAMHCRCKACWIYALDGHLKHPFINAWKVINEMRLLAYPRMLHRLLQEEGNNGIQEWHMI